MRKRHNPVFRRTDICFGLGNRGSALGGLVAEVRKQLRAEILTEVGLLRADIEIAKKAADARELDHGAIIDLPKLLGRKRSA
jgi:hypothetical protein